MRKSSSLILEEEIFKGNLLDIGMENYGIMYNAYKQLNDEVSIDYVSGREEECVIRHDYYDNCILLFSLNKILLKKNKRKLIQEIYKYLKIDGNLYIWDIDKGSKKTCNCNIKIETPDKKIKEIIIKDMNIFKDNSKKNTLNLLKSYFEVIDFKEKNGLYYIRATKIERKKGANESGVGCSKC